MRHPLRLAALQLTARWALLSAALVLIALPQSAGAQSGSAGGSIGNDEQSLSGTRNTERTRERSAPREAPRREPRRAAKPAGGGGGSVDGAWAVTSVSQTCGSASEAIVITSGRIIGQYTNGHVSAGGQATGAGASGGVSWTSSGRFSGRSGSGTFRRSDGCVGRWTAVKQ